MAAMKQDAGKELIRLCSSIMADGEVSCDEAYALADWLNRHPDVATSWPGNELIKPLQEIWADGKVDKRELHRLARLLTSVQREWARHPQTKITHVSGEPGHAFNAVGLQDVKLPSLSATYQVPSQNDPRKVYEVDLAGPSCTCPDWVTWRSNLPHGDLTRCCKHVLFVYARLMRRGYTDGWLAAFIDNGWPPHPRAEWHVINCGDRQALFCTQSEKGWSNVFALDGGQYSRYGYCVTEHRWAYGSRPEGASSIASAICSCKPRAAAHVAASAPIASADFDAVPPRRSRSIAVAVVLSAVALIIIIAVAWETLSNDSKPLPIHNASGTASQSSATFVTNNVAAAAEPTPLTTPQQVQAPSSSSKRATEAPTSGWTTRLIRSVRVKVNGRDVVLKQGTSFRVLGRSDRDVMISYEYAAVTVPASSTDLH